jgi:membrane protease YdiL (CAAX protease family)
MRPGPDEIAAPLGKDTCFGLKGSQWAIVVTSAGLQALVGAFLPERLRVPAGLAASALISALALRAGASLEDQGLAFGRLSRGALHGLAAVPPVCAAIATGLCFRRSRAFYQQARITNVNAGRAIYEMFIRIPLGTALPEEVIFRGALLGVLSRDRHVFRATAISSILFGVWHIAPTLDRLEDNPELRPTMRHKAASSLLSVSVTTAAGLLLAGLRYSSGSLVAPWMAHSVANAAGYAASRYARRYVTSGGSLREPAVVKTAKSSEP